MRPPRTAEKGRSHREGPGADGLDTAARRGGPGLDRLGPTRPPAADPSFENRQDALLTWLDERGLADQVWGVLRHIVSSCTRSRARRAQRGRRSPEALKGDATARSRRCLRAGRRGVSRPSRTAGPVPEEERDRFRPSADGCSGGSGRREPGVKEAMAKDDDEGGGFSGKRNKSWREIDAGRGKGEVPLAAGRPEAAAHRAQRELREVQAGRGRALHRRRPARGLAKTFDPEGKRRRRRRR